MKFGKNLEAGIEQKWQTWRSYALSYNAMKRLLPELDDESDIQEFHESSDRSVTFWNIYEKCLETLQSFYDERLELLTTKLKELQGRFESLRLNHLSGGKNNHLSNVDSIDHLLETVTQFQEETDLILEFLEINRTACRKILKKYDKRTQSSEKEERMSQLLETHGFLFGGGLIAGIKFKSDAILQKMNQMQTDASDTSSSRPKAIVPKYKKLSEAHLEEAQFILDEVEKSHLFSSNHKRQNAIFSRQGKGNTIKCILIPDLFMVLLVHSFIHSFHYICLTRN